MVIGKLTPFVSDKILPTSGDYTGLADGKGPRSPLLYLERWKAENGVD